MKTTISKVSIIIPVYNGSNFLKDAIDSALAQTYNNIEVIVVNDGSNDNGVTEKIARSYGDQIRYYKKENGGVATALNFGIAKMTGSYFSWLSHDDLYEKTKIADQINFLNSFQSDDIIVACNARALYANGIHKKEPIDKRAFNYFDIFLATSAAVGVNGCSLLIPKKALVGSNGFDVNLPVTQDYDLWFRLKNKYMFVLLEKNLVISRRHDLQDSVLKHKLMVISGDKLHSGFLNNIPYERFKEYFSDNKTNIKHTLGNYKLYKTRGYNKTALIILKNILRYYYENDMDKFYKVFNSEVGIISNSKLSGTSDGKKFKLLGPNNKQTSIDYQGIILECDKLLNVVAESNIIDKHLAINENPRSMKKLHNIARRFGTSIRRDGVYLTGEKIVRKVYTKAIRRKR